LTAFPATSVKELEFIQDGLRILLGKGAIGALHSFVDFLSAGATVDKFFGLSESLLLLLLYRMDL
jgi:hypothetical protein